MSVANIADRSGSDTVTIANGGTVSSVLDLGGSRLAAFLVPAAWDGGNVTVHGSQDGTTYALINLQNGSPLEATPVAGQWTVLMDLDTWAFRYIKLIAASAVGANRVITVLSMPVGG